MKYLWETAWNASCLEFFKSISLIGIGAAMMMAALIASLIGKKAQAVMAGAMMLLLLSAFVNGCQLYRSSGVDDSGPAEKTRQYGEKGGDITGRSRMSFMMK